MLNHSERRRLQAIERSLEDDDPELAERLRTADWKRQPNRRSHLNVVTVAGIVLALGGLVLGPPVILLGLVLVAAGFWLHLLLHWSAGPDDQNDTNGVDSSR